MTFAYFPSSKSASNGSELSRLLTAAVVNRGFCKLLLTNPAKALERGYHGESFRLGSEDQELILSIRAKSLADLAMQISVSRDPSGLQTDPRKSQRLRTKKYS